ncbi:M67 family metallopeptidase [Hyphomicrobium sp.]|jgi:proteasome lid subunit RPN8/RPN11|uniref:M67 family metallopeptidase n=1 Tax=Hyphomicrobium sp. TaxID=82 RepID=UPI002C29AEEE|nr:M67 family metallopeptidase [Hyphomicrobium sp.]HVT25357.1 M67 family metallopeptidase [Rhizomicrobium sp.]HVZ03892.1 M67 family metallopeptidase [Hyphomicrobium sp.]
MIATLILPQTLRDQIAREALAAQPSECCGLIEGTYIKQEARALACHPTRNLAAASDSFEIDPARHIELLRTLRGTQRRILGCYHSHPNGRAEPSSRDLAQATDENFLWLIAAGRDLKAFVHANRAFHPVRLA